MDETWLELFLYKSSVLHSVILLGTYLCISLHVHSTVDIPWDRYVTDITKTENIHCKRNTSQKPYTLQLHSRGRSEYFVEIGQYILYPVQTFFFPQVCCLMTLNCLCYMALLLAEWLWIISGIMPTGGRLKRSEKTCHNAVMLTANFWPGIEHGPLSMSG